jgi:hypothetical protein
MESKRSHESHRKYVLFGIDSAGSADIFEWLKETKTAFQEFPEPKSAEGQVNWDEISGIVVGGGGSPANAVAMAKSIKANIPHPEIPILFI